MDVNVHYIVYDNRSGSTLLSALLHRYEGVNVTPECDFTHRILEYKKPSLNNEGELDSFFRYMMAETRLSELKIPVDEFRKKVLEVSLPISRAELVKVFVQVYFAKKGTGAKNLIVKSPNIYFHLEELKDIFPDLKFIHIYRDGRAVFNSKIKSITNGGKAMSNNPYGAAKIWKSKIDLISRNDRVIHVQYEKIIANTEESLNKLLDNLGVDGSDRNLVRVQESYFHSIGNDQTYLHGNLLKKPDKKHLDKWKKELKPSEILVYETIAGAMLKKMGYQLETDADAYFLTFYHRVRHFFSRLRNAVKYFLQGRLKHKMKYQITKV